jgi:hypothetical protein
MRFWSIVVLLGFATIVHSFSIEGEVSYYYPTESIVRKIYSKSWVDYGVYISQDICLQRCLSLFAGADYLARDGYSLGGHQKTRLQLVPLTFGLKWTQPAISVIDWYIGLAPRIYWAYIRDHNPISNSRIHKTALGIYATTGIFIKPVRHFFIDLFLNYSYATLGAPHTPYLVEGHSLQVGGIHAGGGLGYIF